MVARLNIVMSGQERVVGKLSKLGQAKFLSGEMAEKIAGLAIRSVQRGIRDQKSPDGTAYKSVSRYGSPGKRLQDTRALYRSLAFEIRGTKIIIGTNLLYAARQHYGGVVTPVRAKMLAIPLSRMAARAVATGGGFRAAFPNAFTFVSKAGNVLLAMRKSDGGLELLAVLKRSVKIWASHFLGLSKAGESDILAYVERSIGKFVEGT
jgi:phage gpG-like protein